MYNVPAVGRKGIMIISSGLMAASIFIFSAVNTEASNIGLNVLEYIFQSCFNDKSHLIAVRDEPMLTSYTSVIWYSARVFSRPNSRDSMRYLELLGSPFRDHSTAYSTESDSHVGTEGNCYQPSALSRRRRDVWRYIRDGATPFEQSFKSTEYVRAVMQLRGTA